MTVAASPRAVHIVTTAGPGEGRGHLARSIAMAEALAAAGAEVSLELLRGRPSAAQAARLEELGVLAGASTSGRAVLVDLPDPNEIGERWPTSMLAIFDDRETYEGGAQIIIQPSLATWSGAAQAGSVLAGYDFAPIRASIRELAARSQQETAPSEVLICFGGSDPADVSGRIAQAVASDGTWRTTVIVGPDYRGRLVDRLAAGVDPGEGAVVRDPQDLDVRLATATLVVGGAGTMKFELALLGRPIVLLAVADDQLPVGPPFAATGAARFLGDGRTIEPAAVRAAVTELMRRAANRSAMGAIGRRVVDGLGADRVVAALATITEVTPDPRRIAR